MADLDNLSRNDVNISRPDDGDIKVDVLQDADSILDRNRLAVNATGIVIEDPYPGIAYTAFALDGASKDLNVDGSVTPVEFEIVPPTGFIYYIHTVIITMVDSSINFTKFGGITALTNGIKIEIKQDGGSLTESPQSPIKVNKEFYQFGYDTTLQSATEDIFVAKLLVKIDSGTIIKLVDSSSDLIKITVRDDLTAITDFKVVALGYIIAE